MSKFNYRWHRSRLKIPSVDRLPVDGIWKTVAEAAYFLAVSETTVRKQYLLRKLDAVRFGRIIYVNLDTWDKN